jgi:hypothetical protein
MATDTIMGPVHPGEILLEEFLKPLSVSQYHLAKEIWINLQSRYDLEVEKARLGNALDGIRPLTASRPGPCLCRWLQAPAPAGWPGPPGFPQVGRGSFGSGRASGRGWRGMTALSMAAKASSSAGRNSSVKCWGVGSPIRSPLELPGGTNWST